MPVTNENTTEKERLSVNNINRYNDASIVKTLPNEHVSTISNPSYIKKYDFQAEKKLKTNYDTTKSLVNSTSKVPASYDREYLRNSGINDKIIEGTNIIRSNYEISNRNYEASLNSVQNRKNSLKQMTSPREATTENKKN